MRNIFLVFSFLSFVISSCTSNSSNSNSSENYQPRFDGSIGELIVVLTKDQEKSILGETVTQNFTFKPYNVTPQSESAMDLMIKTPEQYQKYFRFHRNVITVNIGQSEEHRSPNIKLYRSQNSKGQMLFELKADSRTNAAKLIEEKSDYIIDLIEDEEILRIQSRYEKINNKTISDMIFDKYGIDLIIPKEYQVAEERPDFAWLIRPQQGRRENVALEKAIMVYTYPYENDSTFTPEFLFAKRDSILKHNAPGMTERSYMATEYGHGLPPQFKEITHLGDYAAEIKGLWRVHNDFMGGPYVSLTKLDEETNQIITVEGYVYAPHESKREHIRSVEAVVKSMKFRDNKQ